MKINEGENMKLRPSALIGLFIFLLLPFLSYANTIEKIQINRLDGSSLNGYLSLPNGKESYPMAIIVHGSPCESVRSWHEDFKQTAQELGAALVTLEKQGVYSPDDIDFVEYDFTNTFDLRLEDHLLLIETVRKGQILPAWNGRIIMIGGSEGGRVAAAVSAQTPEVKATALFTCGGGLTTREELIVGFTKYMNSYGESEEEIAETLVLLEEKIQEMIANPTPEKKFLDYTYKWWTTHLKHHLIDDLIHINHPVYYAHGTEDAVVPIESADKLAEYVKQIGKTDFYYDRVEGYGHNMRTFPPQVMAAMMRMLHENLHQLFP